MENNSNDFIRTSAEIDNIEFGLIARMGRFDVLRDRNRYEVSRDAGTSKFCCLIILDNAAAAIAYMKKCANNAKK